jgi:hypothetical protein
LDEQHREFVLGIIGKQQTIITTAEEDVLTMLKREKTNINLIHLDE